MGGGILAPFKNLLAKSREIIGARSATLLSLSFFIFEATM
jgi:hypothetical protein